MIQQMEAAGGLQEIIAWQESQRTASVKRGLQSDLVAAMTAEDAAAVNKNDQVCY